MKLSTACPAPAGSVLIRDTELGTAARQISRIMSGHAQRGISCAVVPRADESQHA